MEDTVDFVPSWKKRWTSFTNYPPRDFSDNNNLTKEDSIEMGGNLLFTPSRKPEKQKR